MDAIAAARALLPPWIVWGNALLYPLMAFLLTLLGAWLGVRIASVPLRRLSPSAPWTERARRTFPARIVARRSTLLALLVFVALGLSFTGPCNRVPAGELGLLGGATAYAAATCVRWRVERRAGLAEAGLRAWLRGLFADVLIIHPYLLIALLLFALLPDHLDATALIVFALGLALLLFFAWGGGLFLARAAGLARPADERLQKIVETAAARTGIQPRAVYVISSTMTNAWAFPLSKRLAFTESILAALDDGELTATCNHELGHLTEPLWMALCRLSPLLFFAVLGAARPILAVGGFPALVALNLAIWLALLLLILLSRLSQRMERRADRIAGNNEGASDVYARALEKIHQANLIPGVLPGRFATHPHLYDRLLAAGVTPDYERPRPPSRALMMTALIVATVLITAPISGKAARWIVGLPRSMRGNESVVLASLAFGGGSTDLSRLAYLHHKRNDKEGAIAFYRAAMELDPDSVYDPAKLAIALSVLDRCEEASQAAAEAASRCARNNSPTNKHLVQSAFDALRWCQAQRKLVHNAAPPDEDAIDP